MASKGKEFEKKFEEDFLTTFPKAFVMRIKDQMSGYKNASQNLCDYICFNNGFLYCVECKSIEKQNTFPFQNLKQFEKLSEQKNIEGVSAGVVIWFIKHKKVCWVPIDEFIRLKNEGYKSINVKMIDDGNFKVYNLESKPKRVFLDTDYSLLEELAQLKEISPNNQN